MFKGGNAMKKITTIKKQSSAKVFSSCHFSKGDGW
jgi:hypothetical protein